MEAAQVVVKLQEKKERLLFAEGHTISAPGASIAQGISKLPEGTFELQQQQQQWNKLIQDAQQALASQLLELADNIVAARPPPEGLDGKNQTIKRKKCQPNLRINTISNARIMVVKRYLVARLLFLSSNSSSASRSCRKRRRLRSRSCERRLQPMLQQCLTRREVIQSMTTPASCNQSYCESLEHLGAFLQGIVAISDLICCVLLEFCFWGSVPFGVGPLVGPHRTLP